ncbi:MFS transporter [Pararhizobium mangrovi]|uniref:MFS transporter n=2 Tax=Pararhizobium mangrovi TaxID=2590452 RepID=A0A506TVJ0_9HYPH|nr:MFS transporter [Pararhizobium mangrovi]
MGGFAIGTTEFATMSLLPYFAKGLGIDQATAGHVISAYALGVVVGAPAIAVLAAKLARRTLLIALMLVFAVTNAASALAPTYGWMLVFRFMSGLPHGAYFGVAALMASSLVPPHRRALAVGRTMIGLTVATVVGVPFANVLGQVFGWRWGFVVVAAFALATVGLIALFAPRGDPIAGASPLRELGTLARRQVWLTLAIAAVGFGGMFAVYSYAASTLLTITGTGPAMVPVVLCLFGVGATLGTLAASWAADKALMATAGGILAVAAVLYALFPLAAPHVWSMASLVFLIGAAGGLSPVLQTRLMDVAGDAQTLAAAMNHSAFNVANALGPLLTGMAIEAGYGFTSAGWVGCALALAGIAIWAVSLLDMRNRGKSAG